MSHKHGDSKKKGTTKTKKLTIDALGRVMAGAKPQPGPGTHSPAPPAPSSSNYYGSGCSKYC